MVKEAFDIITSSLNDGIQENNENKIKAHFGMLKIISENANMEWETLAYLEHINNLYHLKGVPECERRLLRAELLFRLGEVSLAEDELKVLIPLITSQQQYAEIQDLKRKIKEYRENEK